MMQPNIHCFKIKSLAICQFQLVLVINKKRLYRIYDIASFLIPAIKLLSSKFGCYYTIPIFNFYHINSSIQFTYINRLQLVSDSTDPSPLCRLNQQSATVTCPFLKALGADSKSINAACILLHL
jgi:hypothetical protein